MVWMPLVMWWVVAAVVEAKLWERCDWERLYPGDWSHIVTLKGDGTRNVKYNTWGFSEYSCGAFERLLREQSEINVTFINEMIAFSNTPYGQRYNSQRLKVIQESLAQKDDKLDVLELDDPWVGTVREDLLGVDPTLELWKHFHPDALFRNEKGEVIAAAHSWNYMGMLYRADLLKKYNRRYPESWEELGETALYIQEAERRAGNTEFWGFTHPRPKHGGRVIYLILPFLAGFGGGQVVEDNGTVTVGSQRAVEALRWWAGQIGRTIPSSMLTDFGDPLYHFQDGNALFSMMWAGDIGDIGEEAMETVYRPKGWEPKGGPCPGGCRFTAGSWYTAVNKHTKEPDMATALFLAGMEGIVANKSRDPDEPRTLLVGERGAAGRSVETWEAMCKKVPVLCEYVRAYPDMPLVHRPAMGCGSLYTQCVDIVYKGATAVLRGETTAEAGAAEMERELKVLLGYVEETRYTDEGGMAESRKALIVVVVVVVLLLVLAGVWIGRGVRRMPPGRGVTIPVGVMMGLVVVMSLLVVLPAVISSSHGNSTGISRDLGNTVRVQSLRGIGGIVDTRLDSLAADTRSISEVKHLAVSYAATYLGEMQLPQGALVVVVDRKDGRVMLSSSPTRQGTKGVEVGADVKASPGLNTWVKAGLLTFADWRHDLVQDEEAHRLDVDGERVYVNFRSVQMLTAEYFNREDQAMAEWMEQRTVSWLIMYFVPEETVLGKANDALDEGLDLAVMLSLVALVVGILCALLVTSPLVSLASDVEQVRLMRVEKVGKHTSLLTEVNALMAGFAQMTAMLTEYKAFMPQTVFRSEGHGDESDGNGNKERRSSQLTASSRESSSRNSESSQTAVVKVSGFTLCSSATVMIVRVVGYHDRVYSGADGHSFANYVVEVIENAVTGSGGVVHQMSGVASSDIMVTWNAGSNASCAQERACALAVGLRDRRLPLAVGLATEKVKVGNVGTSTMRSFAVVGPARKVAEAMVLNAAELVDEHPVVVTGGALAERVKGKVMVRPVDLIEVSGRMLEVVEVRGVVDAVEDEWMYQLSEAEKKDPAAELFNELEAGKVPDEVVKELEEVWKDPVGKRIVDRIRCCPSFPRRVVLR